MCIGCPTVDCCSISTQIIAIVTAIVVAFAVTYALGFDEDAA